MKKTDLIRKVAHETGTPSNEVQNVIDAFCSTVTGALSAGDEVAIPNFGCFKPVTRKERAYISPATGELGVSPEHTAVKFVPYTALKNAVK